MIDKSSAGGQSCFVYLIIRVCGGLEMESLWQAYEESVR